VTFSASRRHLHVPTTSDTRLGYRAVDS